MIKSTRDRDKRMQCHIILAKNIIIHTFSDIVPIQTTMFFLVFIKVIPFFNVFLLLLLRWP